MGSSCSLPRDLGPRSSISLVRRVDYEHDSHMQPTDALKRMAMPGDPDSLSARFRSRRWDTFSDRFPDLEQMTVLDLGGTPTYWQSAPRQPSSVTVVNLRHYDSTPANVKSFVGDACSPPKEALDDTFDLVVSNSLIEHVGGHVQRQKMADVVHGAAPRHWVQTPYRYFPIEPHWIFPGLQFMPFAARVRVTKRWKLGHRHTREDDVAVASVHEVDLIGARQMRSYFPDSTIVWETFAGLRKSMTAILA